MKYVFEYTKKQLDMLLLLRKKERYFSYLQRKLHVKDDVLDQMLSMTAELHYTENDRHRAEPIRLNQLGDTVAQAEFDRRFDMYFTRAMSFLAIVVSFAALIATI